MHQYPPPAHQAPLARQERERARRRRGPKAAQRTRSLGAARRVPRPATPRAHRSIPLTGLQEASRREAHGRVLLH
eukprot:6515913-Prymnesium_polylepis.1